MLDNRCAAADIVHLVVNFSPFVFESQVQLSGAAAGAAFARVRPISMAPVALKIQWDGGADENVMPQGIFRS